MSSRDNVDKNQHVKSVVTAKHLTKNKNDGKTNIKDTTKETKTDTKKEIKKEEELERKCESQQENDIDDNKDEADDDDDDDYSYDSDDGNTKTQRPKEAKTNAASKNEESKKSLDKIMKNTKGASKTVENDDDDEDDDELNPKDLKSPDKVKTVNDDDDDDSGDADDDEDEDDDDSESDNVDDDQEDKSKGENKAKKVDDSDDDETDDDETEEEGENNEKQEENNIEEDGKKNSESEAGEEDESGDETASSIPSLKDDDSRKGSDDDPESLNSSQQPILRLSAMSHISGMSDVLPKKVTPEPEAGENNDEEPEHEREENNEKELDENGEQIKDGEMPQEEMIESDRSFSPVDVSLSEFDDKDSDCFNERTLTERELSTRQAETPSDRAESTLSYVSVRNKMISLRNARENEEGALTSEPEFEKMHNAKSREIMRRNKHRIWYEIPETTDDERQSSAKTRKKTQEKRRTEMRARSRRKRSATSAAHSANRDSRNSKSGVRKRKKKPRRKRAQKEDTCTSIVLVERTEKSVTFEECNSSGESIRPIDSAMSIRVVENRYDFFEEFSDSRSSVHPDSSGESGDLRRKQTPDIESEEEVKPKKRRRGKTKNNAKDAKDEGENAKDKGGQKRTQKYNDAEDTAEQRKVNDKEQDKEKCNREDDTSEVNLKKKKRKKREDKEEQEANQYDDEVHELTKQDNEVLEEKSHEGNDRNQIDHAHSENEKKDSKKITSESEVDNRNHKDRGDSGFSRSTQSSSPMSRHASSKWAYRTINLHPDSESEVSGPQPKKKDRLPKWKRTPRKKSKELPVVRGIPRVIRRVKTETMLMAGRYCNFVISTSRSKDDEYFVNKF